ncbi:hypothetical protein BDA96_07G040800 [Sorghum bicolor]|uniref:RING-type domain-containing protein n=3 Tax=Sorghum bicolor TaxID=4558 RepID=A0A921QL46_SORBI|nr:hypothetical protein BDA96_07G040800 [Sorghum bicolor]KXG24411.2 hypothetical protein SORBI_3007G038700 [Sorghum bicolor]
MTVAAAAAWPVCTICYEDLRPLSDQHLHCLPACGHVFHALCLEQWLEYCPGGKKKRTCPICKQACGAAHPPTRLYFSSTGTCPTQACPSSPGNASGGADPAALAAEVARLEHKAASLGKVVEEQRETIDDLKSQAALFREQMERGGFLLQAAKKEKESLQMLLSVKTEELSRKTSECGRLQEKSLALAKELAALKLSADMNLQEEEILKLASLGNHGNLQNAVDVLKRSLAMRNKSYKELMVQCNVLGRSESRMQQKLEKAKELIKKLRARVLELEKELEDKENSLLRDLRSSKKFKADHIKSGNVTANNAFTSSSPGYENQTNNLDEVMQDPCNDKTLDRLNPEAKRDLNAKDNLVNKNADVIDLEANASVFGGEQKAQYSAKPFGTDDRTLNSENKSNLCQNDDQQSMAFECTTTHVAEGGRFLKHQEATVKSTFMANIRAKLHIPQESPSVRTNLTSSTWESETLTIDGISKQATRLASGTGPQQIHNINSLSDDFQAPGIPGMDGARKGIGKWCKGSTAPGSASGNRGSLIAVGPDGRGGKVKILRDLGRSQDSKSQALWPKAPKVGNKGGQSQIHHFFGKR